VLCCVMLCYIILRYIILYYIILCYIILYYIILYYIILYYIILYYIILYYYATTVVFAVRRLPKRRYAAHIRALYDVHTTTKFTYRRVSQKGCPSFSDACLYLQLFSL